MHLTNSQLRQMILEQLEAGPDPELIRLATSRRRTRHFGPSGARS